MKTIKGSLAGLIAALFIASIAHSQTTTPDSVVQIAAEAKGLSTVAPETVPLHGTFWLANNEGSFLLPMPWLPDVSTNAPIFSLGDGQFLIDDTGGTLPQPTWRQTQRGITVSNMVERQGSAVMDLIDTVREAQAEAEMRELFPEMYAMDSEEEGGGESMMSMITFPDPGLRIVIPTNALATAGQFAVILTNTIPDEPYDVLTKSDLAQALWSVEVPSIYAATNCIPVTLNRNGRTNLFVWARYAGGSTGGELPDWWLLEYFGTTDIDPYDDPDGDGWNNLKEYQNGTNPTQFNTPPPPKNVTAALNSTGTNVVLTWQSGGVTPIEYGIIKSGTELLRIGGTNLTYSGIGYLVNNYYKPFYAEPTFQIRAYYSTGTAQSQAATVAKPILALLGATIVNGTQQQTFLSLASPPTGLSFIRFYWNSLSMWFDLSATNLVNGMLPIPTNNLPLSSLLYYLPLSVKAFDANGNFGETVSAPFFAEQSDGDEFLDEDDQNPFVDGRLHMKENLKFLLRSASMYSPFKYLQYSLWYPEEGYLWEPFSADYTYYGFRVFDAYNSYQNHSSIDPLRPIRENFLWRNYVFNQMDITNGEFRTGASESGDIWMYYREAKYIHTGTGASLPLALTNATSPLLFLPTCYVWTDDGTGNFVSEIGADVSPTDFVTLAANGFNLYGLPINSLCFKKGTSGYGTITPGGSGAALGGNSFFFLGVDAPQLAITNYYFASQTPFFHQFASASYYSYDYPSPPLPGSPSFSPTNTSPLLITGIGQPIAISGWAKMAILNGYSDKFGYLEQYFDKAYTTGTNGIATTNSAGILSPYGDFTPTMPGRAALVTMSDIDSGQRGTGFVQVVSLACDRSGDGIINGSFIGPDITSLNNPLMVWMNNDFDRGHAVDGNDFEQDDFGPKDIDELPDYQQVPDCNYVNVSGQPAIPSTRDLEDYFRLWTPGVAAAMSAAPTNYTVKLTLSGDGQIRIFRAYEPNGGTNYLFDEATASNQVANSASLYVWLLTSSSPIVLTNRTNEHYIFCGVQAGSARINLQIFAGTNLVADTAAYLEIKDIKQMYERWTVGELPGVAPRNVPTSEVDNLAFQYTSPTDTNTPYILFVHGWNMETWEKDRYAEAAFKRLYWQGYHGRFGSFRWPTGNKISSTLTAILHARNYDNSEYQAWQSATGLTNLLTKLDVQYPGQVYLMAHSMGNVVAGEALRLAGSSQLVNTYVAMQGAVPSHAYDATATNRTIVPILGLGQDDGTPNRYANYYTSGAPCYFANSAGAGNYVNFYNTNDYALSVTLWQFDQNLKPDDGTTPAYHYVTPSSTHPSGFYRQSGSIITNLDFPINTYELFAYGVEPRCYAIGAQANVGGVFKVAGVYQQVELDAPPFNFDIQHKYHSGQFRSDTAQRWQFWNEVLNRMGLQ